MLSPAHLSFSPWTARPGTRESSDQFFARICTALLPGGSAPNNVLHSLGVLKILRRFTKRDQHEKPAAMKPRQNSIPLSLIIALLALLFCGVTQAEEIPSSVLTNLSSTTVSGYVDTTVSWDVNGLPAQVPPIIHFQAFFMFKGNSFVA